MIPGYPDLAQAQNLEVNLSFISLSSLHAIHQNILSVLSSFLPPLPPLQSKPQSLFTGLNLSKSLLNLSSAWNAPDLLSLISPKMETLLLTPWDLNVSKI